MYEVQNSNKICEFKSRKYKAKHVNEQGYRNHGKTQNHQQQQQTLDNKTLKQSNLENEAQVQVIRMCHMQGLMGNVVLVIQIW